MRTTSTPKTLAFTGLNIKRDAEIGAALVAGGWAMHHWASRQPKAATDVAVAAHEARSPGSGLISGGPVTEGAHSTPDLHALSYRFMVRCDDEQLAPPHRRAPRRAVRPSDDSAPPEHRYPLTPAGGRTGTVDVWRDG